jgi:hypothetical protein
MDPDGATPPADYVFGILGLHRDPIGAEGNNGDVPGSNGGYMAGVAWDVSLLIIKAMDRSNSTALGHPSCN